MQRTAYARDALAAIDGVELAARPAGRARVRGRARRARRSAVVARCARAGRSTPGYPLGRDYPEHADGLLVAITERRTRADIDRLADVLDDAALAAEAPARPRADGMTALIHRGGRRRADDLRALAARPARVRRAGARRARAPARRAAAGALGAARAGAAAGGLRARDRAPLHPAVEAQLRPRHRLLPARLVHDEAQPASCTSASRRCPGTPGCTRSRTRRARRARSS